MMDVLADCEGRLRDTASRKILLEVTLLKMIEARQAVGIDAVLRQLQQLRAEAGGAPQRPSASKAQAAAAPPPVPATAAEARPPAPVSAGVKPASAAGGDLEQLWSRLVEAVGRASPFVLDYLKKAAPVSLSTTLLTIGFDPEFADQIGLIDIPKNHTLLQTKLSELGYPNVQVKFVQASAPPRRPPEPGPAPAPPAAAAEPPRRNPPPVSTAKDDFRNDPLIQKALEVFKGQIVDAR
jgi:DNA polymerase-3 subunit gamma/tau